MCYHNNTTNLREHLRTQHPETHARLFELRAFKTIQTPTQANQSTNITQPPANIIQSSTCTLNDFTAKIAPLTSNQQALITEKIGLLMALDLEPFSVVEHKAFQDLIQTICLIIISLPVLIFQKQ